MNFLVVNDDGYKSKGLLLLVHHLKKYGNVKVISPYDEQSAMSHRITLTKGLNLTKIDDTEFYHLDGSPADCVRLGVSIFDNIDLVFSGINNGMNIGIDTLYSGTLSAALEANIHGISGVALSTTKDTFDLIESHIDSVIERVLEFKKEESHFCLNINFPKHPEVILGTKFTKCGFFIDPQKLTLHNDGTYKADDYILNYPKDELIDYYAFSNGYISITPITTDKTDYSMLDKLNK